MRVRFPLLLAVLASLPPACGEAAGPDYAPPLVELRGLITATAIPPSADVRVAFAWRKRDPDGNILRVSQDVGVRPEFPVRFSLAVTRLPPDEAMNNATSGSGIPIRYATGTLIVYEDRNHNQALDLL